MYAQQSTLICLASNLHLLAVSFYDSESKIPTGIATNGVIIVLIPFFILPFIYLYFFAEIEFSSGAYDFLNFCKLLPDAAVENENAKRKCIEMKC